MSEFVYTVKFNEKDLDPLHDAIYSAINKSLPYDLIFELVKSDYNDLGLLIAFGGGDTPLRDSVFERARDGEYNEMIEKYETSKDEYDKMIKENERSNKAHIHGEE